MLLDNLKARRNELQKAFEDLKARAYRLEGALIEVNALIADEEAALNAPAAANGVPVESE